MPETLTSVTGPFARRLVPARPDLAAEHLRRKVDAPRFAVGTRKTVIATALDLSITPGPGASRDTQLLHGEAFMVYESRADGLSWGQAELDGYVGYVATDGLGPPRPKGIRVTALWSHIYPEPRVQSRPIQDLPFLAEVSIAGTSGSFARLRGQGHVPRPHLEPIDGDFVAQALRFVGVPYLWGGRTARGLDCSALVQISLLAAGIEAPRDSDMQAAQLGAPLGESESARRGDLVFWPGHVGIMVGPETLLHANGHHMAVASEPLAEATARIAKSGGGAIIMRRRLAAPRPGR